jgi:hypothetical protein
VIHVGATLTFKGDSAPLLAARAAIKLLPTARLAMKVFFKAVAFSSLILGAQIAGAQPKSAAVIAKRQLFECMTKRMSANRTLSYNDAMRACKERLQPPKDVASINPTAAQTKSP